MHASSHQTRSIPLAYKASIQDERNIKCANCWLHGQCLPSTLGERETMRFEQAVIQTRIIPRFHTLNRMGDPFANLFAIRTGHFKTQRVSCAGVEQITGFQMSGDLLGMDAIASGRHPCDAIALEDSEVCEIAWPKLEALCAEMPSLIRKLHYLMSQEISREQAVMLMLARMRAEQRLAVFLMDLYARTAASSGASRVLELRMMRADIGNYLGLTLETVSRLLTALSKAGYLRVSMREVEILNLDGLAMLAAGDEGSPDGNVTRTTSESSRIWQEQVPHHVAVKHRHRGNEPGTRA